MTATWVRLFADRLGPRWGSEEHAASEIGEALDGLVERAAAAFPSFHVRAEDFVAYLADHLPEGEAPLTWLSRARGADLYLAFSCATGSAAAIEALEARCFRAVGASLARLGVPPHARGDVWQRVREILLVARGDERPKIWGYSGTGDLAAWTCVVAVRNARKMKVAASDARADVELEEQPAVVDPEVMYFKRHYRAAFKEAFAAALGELSPRERNVLRLHWVDSLSIDDIGRVFGVHRATAARWVQRARGLLVHKTRDLLAKRLRLSPAELESLAGIVESQVDLSLERQLGVAEPDDGY